MYMIELRAGVGLPVYLGKSDTAALMAKGQIKQRGENGGNLQYYSRETAKYGQPDTWGLMVADVYVGLRWKNTSSTLLNRSGLGIQATIPVNVSSAGYAQIEYKEQTQHYYLGVDKVDMGMFSFGIRYCYNIL